MCKKYRFRLPFQKEHGKLLSTHFKFERQHLHHIYWSMSIQLTCKKSLLVIWESFRLFVNIMSAVDKCSLPNRDNLMQLIHMQLSQKLKTFHGFFLALSKSRLNFEHFKKKFTLIVYLFLRLRPAKSVVRYMCKRPASDYPSKRNMASGSQPCLKLSGNTCTIFIDQGERSLAAKIVC